PSWDQGETCSDSRKRALLAGLGIRQGDRVLDVACGTGVVTALLHELTQSPVVGVDISPKMIEIARGKYADRPWASFHEGDFVEMDVGQGFDFVLIYNAYPHFEDPRALSAKIAEVLKPSGRFAILHSLSRAQLDMHHAHCMDVSRRLLPPKEEAKYFEREFCVEQASEGDDYYLIAGAKRS
ncbi:MAG: class I SAM-dependent methyltransferase, partial [Clostridia bacterium]|nr:class I SAM-dependent methyltransferase [Clostridia bacterium]